MRILFISPGFSGFGIDYPSTLAEKLAERGHDVSGLCFASYPQIQSIPLTTAWTLRSVDRYIYTNITEKYPWITGQGRWWFNWFLYHRWKRITKKKLQTEDYDVIVTTRICIAPSTIAATEMNVPSVIITTGPATLKYDPENKRLDKTPHFWDLPKTKQIQYPFIQAVHRWNERAFHAASEVVAMSEFDASITRETFNRESRIVYLPVQLEEFESPNWEPTDITLVNPRDRHKGLDTFLEIARQLPDQSFQIAGILYDRTKESDIDQLDNVTYFGWCDDMQSVYASTKLLLVPSTYQEGGGRVVAEAFVNGIPVIGSELGGIPDYIGNGGDLVEKYEDPDAWVEVIEQYLSDREYYEKKSENARQRSDLFDIGKRVNEFERILEYIVTSN